MTQSIEQQAEERYPGDILSDKLERNAFIAGYQQALDSAPRWVKASEKLPGKSDSEIIWRHTHRPVAGIGYHSVLGFTDGTKRYDEVDFIEYLYEPKTETDGK